MIELNYTLEKEDYTILQQYAASKNPLLKRQRRRGRFVLLGILALLGILFLKFNTFISYYFFAMSVIAFLLYPIYSRWFYKRLFKKSLKRSYKEEYNTLSLKIGNEIMESSTKYGNSSLNMKELLGIIEIGNYFLIQQTEQIYFIIPKNKIPNVDELKSHLLDCSRTLQVPYLSELDWEWK